MQRAGFAAWMLSLFVIMSGMVCGQAYPYKPVRIVTSNVGGGNDFVARLIAQGISGALGQQVIVENRAISVIPGETVAKALPDGYTLLVAGGSFWIAPLIQKTPYDPVKDFAPITIGEKAPLVLVVHTSIAANSVKELIALARAKGGDGNSAKPYALAPGRQSAKSNSAAST